jgi:hypothetical protein
LASGVATAGGVYEQSQAGVSGLDAELAQNAAEGNAVAEQGRASAGAIRDQARSVAAALAPMGNSATGAQLIVAAMDQHLAAMQQQMDTTTTHNQVLQTWLRQLVEAYRPLSGAHGSHGDIHTVGRQNPAPLSTDPNEVDDEGGEEFLNGFVDGLILGGAWTWAGGGMR